MTQCTAAVFGVATFCKAVFAKGQELSLVNRLSPLFVVIVTHQLSFRQLHPLSAV